MKEDSLTPPTGHGEPLSRKSACCRTCGACCSFSREWPRFTLETDAEIDLIPPEFVDESLSGMRCNGDRCSALIGKVGFSTSCGVYSLRPDVCRACEPGDDACKMARRHFRIDDSLPSDVLSPELR